MTPNNKCKYCNEDTTFKQLYENVRTQCDNFREKCIKLEKENSRSLSQQNKSMQLQINDRDKIIKSLRKELEEVNHDDITFVSDCGQEIVVSYYKRKDYCNKCNNIHIFERKFKSQGQGVKK